MTPPRTVKAILFDLDGTLLDTEALSDKAILQALGHSLPKHVREERRRDGDRLPWEIKKQILGLRAHDWVPMVIDYFFAGEASSDSPQPLSVSELANAWETNLGALSSEVQACRGARELVEAAAELGLPLAIATSSRYNAVAKKRMRHECMFRHMKTIVAGDDPAIQNGKPAPDMYLEAAKRLGVDPCECLVFEDSMSGVKSGKAAGCIVVAIPDPRMDKSTFEAEANVVLDNLTQFDGRTWCIDINMNDKSLLPNKTNQ